MPDGVFTVSPVNDFLITTTKAGARGAIDAASLADIAALNEKFDHVPIDITSFSVDIPIAQKGATLTSLTFNWAVNKVPVEQYLNGGAISNSITSLVKAVSITADTTYTLTAFDGTALSGNTDTASLTVRFQSRFYYGTSASATLTSSQVIGLANKPFATGRARTFTIVGGGQYIYIAYPQSFGDATFKVNGLNSTAFTKLSPLSFTNESGFTETYTVYRTDDVQTGTFEIQVL